MAESLPRVLVTDFDGTLTGRDFYQVFCERCLPEGITQIWDRYRAGEIDHFEAMRRIFASAAPGEEALLEMASQTRLEPELKTCLKNLHGAGWEVVVVSAGSRWYIERILRAAGVDLVVHTNEGKIEKGRLMLTRPEGSPFFSQEAGIDKAGVVRWVQNSGRVAAYAGDGFLDLEASLLVPPQYRFARGDLATALTQRGESFQAFERWKVVAETLCRAMQG